MALSDLKEATPETSSEDIKAYADSVAKEVAEERKGDSKSDAEIVADNSPEPKTPKTPAAEKQSSGKPAETKSQGKQTVEDEIQGEESGEESESPEWLDDDVKAEAAAYGISESEISDFANREEFDRALRLFDKTALEAGRKAMADGEDGVTRNEKGQFVKKEEPKSDEPKEEPQKDGRYEVSLSKDLYDDEIIDEFTRMRDHYESRLEALESFFEEMSAKSEEQQFDNFIDSLGHSELFGKTGKESQKELEHRKDLYVAVKAQMLGLAKLGRPTELNAQLVNRVANMVFAEEFGKKRLKQQTQKVSKQSQLRQGGSPTKPQPPSNDPREEFDRLYKELERV